MSFDSIFEENISGIHFYPIYSLQKSRVVAWEVSVIIYDYACSVSWSERFEINLLHWKLRALKELVNSQKYFIGVPAKLLAQREVVNTILPMMRAGVVIIVKSAHDLITLSASERNEFFALQRKVKECGSA
ncbi:TPA: hypothetical protein R4104_004871, partial [Enterobacter asburiae]|nr:hypothetical protein [Enterobacter asburiae]HED2715664.1 hypothetical protein [Enterobacter asburiae]HED3279898.1 hypothetical protein [Enterobacter asburiae]